VLLSNAPPDRVVKGPIEFFAFLARTGKGGLFWKNYMAALATNQIGENWKHHFECVAFNTIRTSRLVHSRVAIQRPNTHARLDRQSKMSKKKGPMGGPIDPVVGGMISFQAEERFTARNRCRFPRNRRFHFCEPAKQFLDLALLVRTGNVFEFHVLNCLTGRVEVRIVTLTLQNFNSKCRT